MWDIGVNLARLTLERGPRDFPQDGGTAYRNHLYKYVHCYFLWTFYPALLPDTDEAWSRHNRELVLKLQAEPLKQAVGLSHCYARGRQLFLSAERARAQAATNPALVAAAEVSIRKGLDWLGAMYALPAEMMGEWLRLITTERDPASFKDSSQNFFYSQLAHALGLYPGDWANAESWGSLALSTDQASSGLKPEEWQPICEQLMTLYVDEAKRLKSLR
jgi:hypothetical protein